MLRHYFTIGLRNLWRNKFHTAINILGLAIGISACLVIFLIVRYEFSFDAFRQDRDRIFRVYSKFTGAFNSENPGVPTGLPAAFSEGMNGVDRQARFHTWGARVKTNDVRKGDIDHGAQDNLVIAPPGFFALFPDYDWLAGDPSVLQAPNRLVLTNEQARLYFGDLPPAEVLGRTVFYQDSLAMTVAGVVDIPDEPTDLVFTDFLAYATIQGSWLEKAFPQNDWNNTNSNSQFWIRLAPGATIAAVEAELEKAQKQYSDNNEEEAWQSHYYLQPFSDLHFNGDLGNFSRRPVAHLPTLYALILIALLLLLVAAVNFVNLETVQSVQRTKEVGVRKVLGGTRGQLMRQFLGETLIITFLATGLAVLLADWALRWFEEFIPEGLAFDPLEPVTLSFLIGTVIVVGLLAGAYPALALSAFRPVLALKEQVSRKQGGNGSVYLRSSLIVFQFAFAQVLIFGTLVIGRQIDYMIGKDMGFAQDAIVYFYTPWDDFLRDSDKRFVLKEELSRLPAVSAISLHQAPPAARSYNTSILEFEKDGQVLKHNVHRKFGDAAYLDIYDIELVAGRNLLPGDTVREFIINETYAGLLGYDRPADVLQQTIQWDGQPAPVVGVAADFHVQSLHQPIDPVFIATDKESYRCISMKLNTAGRKAEEVAALLETINATWSRIYPESELEYHFIDEAIAGFYQREQRIAKLMRTATGIAVFISCLGLLGLVSFAAVRRTKEIGIRKVLGASAYNIVALLSEEFLKLVIIAAAIAFPVAWYLTDHWLRDFTYRIQIEWWMFALAGLLALLVALLTVGLRAWRAAQMNPVYALRDE